MNKIDNDFKVLVEEINSLSEYELYYKVRLAFLEVNEDIRKSMAQFFNDFPYWGIIDVQNSNYEEIELKVKELKSHIKDLEELYYLLNDTKSKKVLYAILNNWVNYDFNTLREVMENCYDDYFDLDIIPYANNEVYVDLGAYTGDTTLSFIKNYGLNSYQKIYAYEITSSTYEVLRTNLSDYPNIVTYLKGVGSTKGKLEVVNGLDASANTLFLNDNGSIPLVTLDEDISEDITIIKADIEGAEQDAIRGAINHIKRSHPKLLISVYHKNEDLWKIPKMINEIDNTYKFYLRYHGGNIYSTEITLIAI